MSVYLKNVFPSKFSLNFENVFSVVLVQRAPMALYVPVCGIQNSQDKTSSQMIAQSLKHRERLLLRCVSSPLTKGWVLCGLGELQCLCSLGGGLRVGRGVSFLWLYSSPLYGRLMNQFPGFRHLYCLLLGFGFCHCVSVFICLCV